MAAVPTLKGRIGIDGEREFKAAMKAAGNEVKLLDSQLELLKAEFKDGEKTMEYYQREQDALTSKVAQQRQQVATMEDVLAAVKTKFGENSDQAVKYATMLNKAKAALAETEGELRGCAAGMDKLEQSTKAAEAAESKIAVTMRESANAVKVIDSELQLLSSQYKNSEKSLETYQRQQQLLTNKMQAQKAQVAAMTAELEDIKKQYGENSDKTADYTVQLNKAKASLASTEVELQKCTTEMDSLKKSMEEGAKSTKKQGEAAEDAGKKNDKLRKAASTAGAVLKGAVVAGATAAAAALAAVGAAAGKVTDNLTNMGTDYQQASNLLSAQTGATGEELEALAEIAQNVFHNNFGENIGEVNEALATTKTNTGLVGKELEAATMAGFLLKDTFGMDFQESSKTARSLMQNFGISAQEAYNLMAVGAQNGANQNGDMLDVLAEYGPMYASMGMSANQMMNSLIAGNQAGVFSIDKVGDAMKEFSIRCVDGSATTHDAMAAIGLDADAMAQQFAKGGESARFAFATTVAAIMAIEDPVKRNQTAIALFGTQFEDLGADVLPIMAQMATSGDTAADALGQIAAVRYDDLNSSIEGFSRKVKDELSPVATTFHNLAKEVVDDASALLDDGFQPEDAKAIGESLGGAIAEGIKTLLDIDWLEIGGNLLAGLADGLAESFGLGEEWEKIKGVFNSIISGIKDFLGIHSPSTVTEEMGGFLLDGLLSGLEAGIDAACEAVKRIFGKIWDAIKSIFGFGSQSEESKEAKAAGQDIMNGLQDGITGNEDDLKDAARAAAKAALDAIKDEFGVKSGSSTKAKTIAENLIKGLKSGLGIDAEDFKSAAKEIFEAFQDAINAAFGVEGTGFLGLGEKTSTKFKDIGAQICKGLADGIKGSNADSDQLGTAVQDVAAACIAEVRKAFGLEADDNGIGGEWVTSIASGITAAQTMLAAAGKSVADTAYAVVTDVLSSAKGLLIGDSWGRSVSSGISSRRGSVGSAASGLGTAASNALWGTVGTNGSRFNAIGMAISTGIANGIASGQGKITAAATAAAQAAYQAACDELQIHSPSRKGKYIGSNYVQSVAMGMDESRKQVTAAAASVARAASNTTQQHLQVQMQAIDYDRLGQSVARANREAGLGNLALYVGKEKLGQTLEPTVMHAGQTRSRQTVSGRSTRLLLV